MQRRRVVLPEPLGPMMQVDCPGPNARSTPLQNGVGAKPLDHGFGGQHWPGP